MKIYFNWLGEWINLSDDHDYINDMRPSDFIENCITTDILSNTFDNNNIIPIFITITKNNCHYHIPFSQLVWNEKINNFINEEKW